MKKSLFILIFSLVSGLSFAETWVTNRDHSEIMFQVPYMGVSELNGRFNEFTGGVEFKDDGITAEELEVKISANSIDTGIKMRDGHLKGSDFFQSSQHPHIIFKSQNIKLVKPGLYKATGDLTMKGITRPSVIEFTTTNALKDTWGYDSKFVKFKSSVNRKDYKINWNKTLDGKEFLVGDVIAFSGTFQIQPGSSKTPNSKHMIPDTEYIRERDLQRGEEESTFSRKLRKLINGK